MSTFAISADRIVTCDLTRATPENPLAAVLDSAMIIEDGKISAIVPRASLDPRIPSEDFGAFVVTPGLVDAHTHAAWTGSRHDEYAIKMRGGDYRDIAAAGGGIASSHRSIAACSEDDLAGELGARMSRMASLGVTTCEVKSGYGLTHEHELKQLRAINRIKRQPNSPQIVATLLALHALPKNADRGAYIREAEELVDEVAKQSLAKFVDAYIDANAFSVDEARGVCERARKNNLGVRLHVGQFADVGGAELAAEVGARSADHLENVSDAAIEALAAADVHAGLLPTACFTLKQSIPPIVSMRRAKLRMVVASDANPGTAPGESLPLAMALAVRLYGLTPDEAILGATAHAATSLDVDAGMLKVGSPADFVVWDLPHEHAIVQPWGVSKTRRVVRAGMPVFTADS